jgi:uncharacterized protein
MTDLSARSGATLDIPRRVGEIDGRVVGVAGLLLAVGAAALAEAYGWRQGALYLLGGALGLVLYHALFGFTSAWRVFVADRRGAGLRAQMIMLAVACVLFFPTLAHGTLLGTTATPNLAPVGLSVLVGAFLFGLGMQLGGGCASGTLYTVGGGSTRMVVTLAFFIAGSALGALQLPWWEAQASLGPISEITALGGWAPALAVNLVLFAAIAGLTVVLERRRHGGKLADQARSPNRGWRRFVQGPWPLVWGAVALAVGNYATLALSGSPWGVTSAFALWGSKIAALLGADVAHWAYWSPPARAKALSESVFADVTSVMDFGIIVGASLAAGLAGKFAPVWRVPLRSLAAAAIGGVVLGYGARLAYGCNIGAYFSGIASGSLHGWLWLAAAFVGSAAGARLRPLFGLAVERTAAARPGDG